MFRGSCSFPGRLLDAGHDVQLWLQSVVQSARNGKPVSLTLVLQIRCETVLGADFEGPITSSEGKVT